MTTLKSRIVGTLLRISENQYEFTSLALFKNMKISVYFLQLQGYVFSQFETKGLNTEELNYLANYTQLSAITFALLQLGDDELTKFVFYFLFSFHVGIYMFILAMSIKWSNDSKQNYSQSYSILNVFFLNFQWLFVTPFQEISIGMIVCGKKSFLVKFRDETYCMENISALQYLCGILGTLLVSFTGFISIYFFRSYKFNQMDFLRKYSLDNLVKILLHQIIIICYYLDVVGLDYLKHILLHLLLGILMYEAITSYPFGFYQESKFYTSIVCLNEWFAILLSFWIFGESNSSFLFLTCVIILPFITVISLTVIDNQNVQLMTTFQSTIFNQNTDSYLEEIYRVATEYYNDINYRFRYMLIIASHTNKCISPNCPCGSNADLFINTSNNVDWDKLNEWTQYIFRQALQNAVNSNSIYFYENFALKYNTFVERYKNNPVQAYGILQDIMKNQQQVESQLGYQQISFYFKNLFVVLAQKNQQTIQLEQVNYLGLTFFETNLLNDQKILIRNARLITESAKLYLKQLITFWDRYIHRMIDSYQQLLDLLLEIQNSQYQLKKNIKILEEYQLQSTSEKQIRTSIFLTRYRIIILSCYEKNYFRIFELLKQLNTLMSEEHMDNEGKFKAVHFQDTRALSLVASISPGNQGSIYSKLTPKVLQYFGFDRIVQKTRLSNVDDLLPSQFKDIHKHFIRSYVEKGQGSRINNRISTYLMNGQGFIEQVVLSLSIYFPRINNDYQHLLIAHILKVDNYNLNQGSILLGANFNIIGITEQLFTKLVHSQISSITPEEFQQKQSIFVMFPNLVNILKDYFTGFQKRDKKLLVDEEIAMGNDSVTVTLSKDVGSVECSSFSIKERLKTLDEYLNLHQVTIQANSFIQANYVSQSYSTSKQPTDVNYTVSQHLINYDVDSVQTQFPYYEIVVSLGSKQKKKKASSNQIENYQMRINGTVEQKEFDGMVQEKKVHHKMSSEKKLSEADVDLGAPLNESNLSSYRSSQSFHQVLKEFYKITSHLNTFRSNSYMFSGFIHVVLLISLIPIFLAIQQHLLQENINYSNQYEYSIKFIDQFVKVIMAQRHQVLVEEQWEYFDQTKYIVNNSYDIQPTRDQMLQITLQQSLMGLQSIKQISIYKQNILDSITTDELFQIQQMNGLGIDYTIQNMSVLTYFDFITQTLYNLQSQIQDYTFTNSSLIDLRYIIFRNHQQFINLMIKNLEISYELESSVTSISITILISMSYVVIGILQLVLTHNSIIDTRQKRRLLKLFQLTDYWSAQDENKHLNSIYKLIQIETLWLNVPKFDQLVQHHFQQIDNIVNNNSSGNKVQNQNKHIKLKELQEKLQTTKIVIFQSVILLLMVSEIILIHVTLSNYSEQVHTNSKQQSEMNKFLLLYSTNINNWDAAISSSTLFNNNYDHILNFDDSTIQEFNTTFTKLYDQMNDFKQGQILSTDYITANPSSALNVRLLTYNNYNVKQMEAYQQSVELTSQFRLLSSVKQQTTIISLYSKRIYFNELEPYLEYKLLDTVATIIQMIQEYGFRSLDSKSIYTSHNYFIYYIWCPDIIQSLLEIMTYQEQLKNTETLDQLKQSGLILIVIVTIIIACFILGLFFIQNQKTKSTNQRLRACLKLIPIQVILQKKLNHKLKQIL